jgi:hypothetical protein
MKTATKTRKAAHAAPRMIKAEKAKLAKGYPDTKGEELSEVVPTLTEKQQARKDAREAKALAKVYRGAAIPATRVLKRQMEEFKNCRAFAWMILNEQAGTVTYANSYGQEGDGMPRASYDPAVYTYPIKEKVIAKKLDQYTEVEDRDEWPTWISFAAAPVAVPAKRSRKAK